MWRQLLADTDQTGRSFLAVAAILLVGAVAVFVTGIVQATTGHAAATLPYWIGTMACAAAAGGLVYAASRRGDFRR